MFLMDVKRFVSFLIFGIAVCFSVYSLDFESEDSYAGDYGAEVLINKPGNSFYFCSEKPGKAEASVTSSIITFQNNISTYSFAEVKGRWTLTATNLLSGATFNLENPFFEYRVAGRVPLNSNMCRLSSVSEVEVVQPVKAAALEPAFKGVKVKLEFIDKFNRFKVLVSLVLRDNSNYLIKDTEFIATGKLKLNSFSAWKAGQEKISAAGTVLGSPLENKDFFLTLENPFARTSSLCGQTRIFSLKKRWLLEGEKIIDSSALGVFVPGQKRRSFLHYLERRRARSYNQFLHYNSWYDIAWYERPFSQSECLEVIEGWKEVFLKPYGIKLDSFALDDGWDDYNNVWQFHPQRFPDGFTPLNKAAEEVGSGIGVWISPAGGYLGEKVKRLEAGKRQGLAQNSEGFLMSSNSYFNYFLNRCVELISAYQVNYFKFDRLAGSFGEKDQLEDKEAVLKLALKLKEYNPDVFINITVGTWPSPFWLKYCDSTWRGGGGDIELRGKGNNNQKWLNFRDGATYTSVVSRAPYYPVSSLMTHGIVFADLGLAKDLDGNLDDWERQVKSYFASGVNLQELYINYRLLSRNHWGILAKWADWAAKNESVLADTHWIGGNPYENCIYGWASWNSEKGILCLRNSDDVSRTFSLVVDKHLQLPELASGNYDLISAETGEIVFQNLDSKNPLDIELDPFDVKVFELKKKNR